MKKYATHLLIKNAELIKKKANSLLKSFCLTVEQYAVLIRIHEGFDTSTKILSTWGGTKPALANKLSELEKKGFIHRDVSPNDKRVWNFSLETEGLKLIKAVQPLHEKMVSNAFQSMSTQEIKQLTQLLEKVNTKETDL